MIRAALDSLGGWSLARLATLRAMAGLASGCGVRALLPATYNPAMRRVLVRQVYFTAVQVLPLFLITALVLGGAVVAALVSALQGYGLSGQIGPVVVDGLLLELVPLSTAFMLALRSGAAINAEIATISEAGELETLELFDIDALTYLFLPRILAIMLSMILLSGIFGVIVVLGGYLFLYLGTGTGFAVYMDGVTQALDAEAGLVLTTKALAFGFLTAFVPLYSGLHAPPGLTGVPIGVLRGMVRLFSGLLTVEMVLFGLAWL